MALFFISTTSKWIDTMEAAAFVSPQLPTYLFFIVFRIISFMIFIPLFVGIMIQSLMEEWDEQKRQTIVAASFTSTDDNVQVTFRSNFYAMWMDACLQPG